MNKLFYLLFALVFACVSYCQAQSTDSLPESIISTSTETTSILTVSPYELSLKKDLPLYSLGLGIQLAGISAMNNIEPLTVADIELMNAANINSLDRNTIYNYSGKAHATSDILLYSSMAFPLTLMVDKNMRKDALKISMMASQAFILNTGVTTLVKGTVQRTRPYVYNPDVPMEKKFTKTSRMSFFSGHTSTASVMSFFTAKVYSDYYPDSPWKPLVWTLAATVPATTGYLRYKAGKHFPTDVIVGYGVGAAIGVLVPHLHKTTKKGKHVHLSPMASSDAVGFSLVATF